MNEDQELEGRKRITVTSLGGCPEAERMRQLRFPEDPKQYEGYRGSSLHKLFEMISKRASIDSKHSSWEDVEHDQVEIPSKFYWELKKDMPLFEEKIKDFFTNNKLGQELFKAQVQRNEAIFRVPIENLGLPLKTPLVIQMKYVLSGKPDYIVGDKIIEVKSGKVKLKKHLLQALAYNIMLDILEPTCKHRYRRLYFGGEKYELERKSPWEALSQAISDRRPRELAALIDKMIETREKIEKDARVKLDKVRSGDCPWCKYYSICLTYQTNLFRFHKKIK